MEQQPVRRRRRRRRRRTHNAGQQIVAWLAYLLSLFRRAMNWGVLLLILGVILFVGLGAPFTPLSQLFSWWGHW
jgi:hypothetical protein